MKKQFFKNLFTIIFTYGITFFISMFYIPYLYNVLGAKAYSFIPLLQTITNYLGMITISLSSLAAIYFTRAYKCGDVEQAQKVYSTIAYLSFFISLILFIICVLISIFINKIIVIPNGMLSQVRLTFLLFGLTFIINTLKIPGEMATFCENRIDIKNCISVIENIFRVFITVLLFNLLQSRLELVALAQLIASTLALSMVFVSFKILISNIKLLKIRFDKSLSKELLSNSIGSLLNWVGSMLFVQIDLLVANWYLDSLLLGRFSVLVQLTNNIRSIGGGLAVLFIPTIVALIAKKEIKQSLDYVNKSVSFLGGIIALPIGFLIVYSNEFLTMWMDSTFKILSPMFCIMIINLVLNLAIYPIFAVQNAMLKVHIPGVITLIFGIFNLLFEILMTKYLGWGAYGIIISGVIFLTLKNLLFTPLYASKIMGQKWWAFYKGLLLPLLILCLTVLISALFKKIIPINSLFELGYMFIVVFLIIASLSFFFVLTSSERNSVIKVFKDRLKS